LDFAQLKCALGEFTGNSTDTRRKFEKAVGNRWVIVFSEEGDQFHDFSGYVMGFFPSEQFPFWTSKAEW
jgi:hypothetical protein